MSEQELNDALEKALKLKVGDRVRFYAEYKDREGPIEEIWGTVEERTYSFKITYGDSFYHIYPHEILWDET